MKLPFIIYFLLMFLVLLGCCLERTESVCLGQESDSSQSAGNAPITIEEKTPGKPNASSSPNQDAIRVEINSRISMYQERIDKLERDLANLKKTKVNVPPMIVPLKPDYPPVPIKKETAPMLTKEESESEAEFAKRVQVAEENDDRTFQLDQVAYKILVDEIDTKYELNKAAHAKRHEELLDAENKRVAKIKENLPQYEAEVAGEIASIREHITDDRVLLNKLQPTKQITPVAFACAYSELPWFTRRSMSFEGVNISAPRTRIRLGSTDYDLICDYIVAKITFSTLADAKRFQDLSKAGKLYCLAISDKSYWQQNINQLPQEGFTSWSESYSLEMSDEVKEVWDKVVRQQTVPASMIPREKSSEVGAGESSLENIEEAPGVSSEAKPGEISRVVSPLTSIRIYFGTEEGVLTNIEVFLDGALKLVRSGEASEQKELGKETLLMTATDNDVIIAPGHFAGELCAVTIADITYSFRWCPPGDFRMGLGKSSYDVTLTRGFWMLDSEVTQEMYRTITDNNPSRFRGDYFPVEYVSWIDALDFCGQLTKQSGLQNIEFTLPTEAQWEYACRAGTTEDYSFGSDPHRLYQFGNYCDASNTSNFSWQDKNNDDGFDHTAPVKNYQPNPWGLFDMHGNVWEWCSSRYGAYPKILTQDPRGPNTGTFRIFRGGAWSIGAANCKSFTRFGFTPNFRRDDIGFRICVSPYTTE